MSLDSGDIAVPTVQDLEEVIVMKKLKQMTVKQLKVEYLSVVELIDETSCFGTQDIVWQGRIQQELEHRGWGITNKPSFFRFKKGGDNNE